MATNGNIWQRFGNIPAADGLLIGFNVGGKWPQMAADWQQIGSFWQRYGATQS